MLIFFSVWVSTCIFLCHGFRLVLYNLSCFLAVVFSARPLDRIVIYQYLSHLFANQLYSCTSNLCFEGPDIFMCLLLVGMTLVVAIQEPCV